MTRPEDQQPATGADPDAEETTQVQRPQFAAPPNPPPTTPPAPASGPDPDAEETTHVQRPQFSGPVPAPSPGPQRPPPTAPLPPVAAPRTQTTPPASRPTSGRIPKIDAPPNPVQRPRFTPAVPPPPISAQPPSPRPAPPQTWSNPAPHPAPQPPRPTPPPPPTFSPVSTPFTSTEQAPPIGSEEPRQPQLPSQGELGLIRRAKPVPQTGWRKAVHRMTGINPGESDKENSHKRLIERVNQRVRGDYSIAVLSLKGGVGKTTTTIGLGSTFAAIRGDRVIAVDANPDFGTLAQRGPNQSRSTVRSLLFDEGIARYSDIRQHTSQNSSRLEILASERDPATSESFSEGDYRTVMQLLQRFYNIILTDCGTGLVHSAMAGVLDEADELVLVVSPAIDSARSGLATLDWLSKNGYAHLVPGAVVVVSAARPGKMPIDIDLLAGQFLTRVRAVHVIPFDDHLAQGAEVVLDLVGWPARQAFLELAATIADGFSHAARRDPTRPADPTTWQERRR